MNGNRDPYSQGEFTLAQAKSIACRAYELEKGLWAEAKRQPEYGRMFATRERCAKFEAKLLRAARRLNAELAPPLSETHVAAVTDKVARTVANWEHSPLRQRERQRKQAASRRRRNRERDREILDRHQRGESLATIARKFDLTKEGVRKVLLRDKPRPEAKTDTNDTRSVG